jgi:ribose transport system ATP-binding protein
VTPGTLSISGPVAVGGEGPFLSIKSVSKTFGGQKALDGATLDLRAGEVHALLGMNGCGKSTLIKVLAGVHEADGGNHIEVDGLPVHLSTRQSHMAGFRFVHQDLGLIGTLSAAENLELTARRPRAWFSDRALRARARRLFGDYGVDLDVDIPVQELTRAQQSLVAIVRAIADLPSGKGLLVLDEPTASLPPRDVATLVETLDRVRAQGLAVLLVTHRMEEVFAAAQQITVLRDGRTVLTCRTAETSREELTTAIVGTRLLHANQSPSVSPKRHGPPVLEVTGLSGRRVDEVSFSVTAGEILGLTGLVGSGYEEALAYAFGAAKRDAGTVRVGSHVVPSGSCGHAVRAGIGYVPSDRDRLGSIPSWTIAENLTLPAVPSSRLRLLDLRRERTESQDWTRQLEVVPSDVGRRLAELSGGNRQRIALGRWLRRGCDVLLLDEPTIGVDVAGKRRIYDMLRRAAAQGVAVVVASSDHPELLELCDRIVVLRQGEVVARLEADEATEQRLFRASAGTDLTSIRDHVEDVRRTS